jgi:hypothetical protein
MIKMLPILSIVALAGCGSIPVTGSKIASPAAELMRPPRAFPAMKVGDDARVTLVKAAEVHAREARRIKKLQAYVNTVRDQ